MSAPAVPRRLGPYDIVRRLAYGGMAEVFLGRRAGVDGVVKNVAIKRVLPQYCANDAFVTMFRDEARITASLQHGNIAQLVDFGEEDGQYYLVLEYVDGPSLGSVLRRSARHALDVAEAAHVAAEVARALDYAHRKRDAQGNPLGIIHRDVTPSNILISREGEVKLTDFGIARARERLTPETTGGFKGKTHYIAPEAVEGAPLDARADLFALGAVLFQMLTGKHAFDAPNEAGTIAKILFESPPPPSSLNPAVPSALDELVASLVCRDPAGRPARAQLVADTLARAVPAAVAPADLLARTLAQLGPESKRPDDEPAPTVASSRGQRRVLVVDESPTARAVLRTRLGERWLVLEASSATEAFSSAKENKPDVVLCQRGLRGATALSLCRGLRADPELKDVVVVLLTSEDPERARAEAMAAGAHDVAPRSLAPDGLEDLLRRFRS